jgi:hypothetical protein
MGLPASSPLNSIIPVFANMDDGAAGGFLPLADLAAFLEALAN